MRLLLVEDDERIGQPLVQALTEAGYRVTWARTGPDGLVEGRSGEYGIIVLDVMLPGLDGFALARELRGLGVATPTVFLTARDEVEDRVEGLDLGGDAYLVKPFELAELLATLRAVARRGERATSARHAFGDGEGLIDARTRQVWWGGREVMLTAREYELLEVLALTPGRWFRREELVDRVWGPAFEGDSRVVDVYVRYLRRKLGDVAVRSARGRGYSVG